MIAPPFPTNESGFDDWHVYSDWLQTRGTRADQRLGELIARELLLPAFIDKATLLEFHSVAHRVCSRPQRLGIAFSLGHVRSISILPVMSRLHRQRGGPDGGTLANARDILQRPNAQSVEELSFIYEGEHTKHWRRLLAAMPSRCTSLGIWISQPTTRGTIDELIAMIPSHVREITVGWFGRPRARVGTGAPGDDADAFHPHRILETFIDDRFERINLRVDLGALPLDAGVYEKLARTPNTRLTLRSILDTRSLPKRVELGAPDDALLTREFLDESNLKTPATSVVVLRRWTPYELQVRYGILPIRTLLARQLAECYSLAPNPPAMLGVGIQDSDLVRRGDAWTLRGSLDRILGHNGREVLEGIRSVAYGDKLSFETDTEWTLSRGRSSSSSSSSVTT